MAKRCHAYSLTAGGKEERALSGDESAHIHVTIMSVECEKGSVPRREGPHLGLAIDSANRNQVVGGITIP